MENARVGRGRFWVTAFFWCIEDDEVESLRPPGRDRVAEDARRGAIGAGIPDVGVPVSLKVEVVKVEGFHFRIVEMPSHRLLDFGQIVLVHHFVAFEVKGPIPGAVEQSDRFLLAVNVTFHLEIVPDALIPLGVEDADFRVSDLLNHFRGRVVAWAEGDDKLIHNGQNRSDRFDEAVAQPLRIAQKGESADFHAANAKRRPLGKQCFASGEHLGFFASRLACGIGARNLFRSDRHCQRCCGINSALRKKPRCGLASGTLRFSIAFQR